MISERVPAMKKYTNYQLANEKEKMRVAAHFKRLEEREKGYIAAQKEIQEIYGTRQFEPLPEYQFK